MYACACLHAYAYAYAYAYACAYACANAFICTHNICVHAYACICLHALTRTQMLMLYTFSYRKPVIRPQNMPKTADWG